MVKVPRCGKMAPSIRGLGKMIWRMVTVFLCTLKVIGMKASGSKTS